MIRPTSMIMKIKNFLNSSEENKVKIIDTLERIFKIKVIYFPLSIFGVLILTIIEFFLLFVFMILNFFMKIFPSRRIK